MFGVVQMILGLSNDTTVQLQAAQLETGSLKIAREAMERKVQAEAAARSRDIAGFIGRIRSAQTWQADVTKVCHVVLADATYLFDVCCCLSCACAVVSFIWP